MCHQSMTTMFAVQMIGRSCSKLREKRHIARGITAAGKSDPTKRMSSMAEAALASWYQEPLYRDLLGTQ